MKDMNAYLNNFKGIKTLMAIYPHPDDETMAAGGLLMLAKGMGFRTIVVCLTHGEAGQIHIEARGKSLSEIRRGELQKAAKILNIDHLELGDFGDGKLRGTEEKWRVWVFEMVKKYNPGIIVTYDHSGLYGHPDHIALSLVVTHIIRLMKKKPVLFWGTLSKDYYQNLAWTKDVRQFITEPTHFLKLGLLFWKKAKAAREHASQKLGKDMPIPLWLVLAIFNFEWYHQVDLAKEYPFKYLDRKF